MHWIKKQRVQEVHLSFYIFSQESDLAFKKSAHQHTTNNNLRLADYVSLFLKKKQTSSECIPQEHSKRTRDAGVIQETTSTSH